MEKENPIKHFERSYNRAKSVERTNVFPNSLDEVIGAIKKIEDDFNLRPRQLESVIQFQRQYLREETSLPREKY